MAEPEGTQQHLTILETQRHRDGRLAFERGALSDRAEPRHDAGTGILARDGAEARHHAIERIDRGADVALGDNAIDAEALQHRGETHDGDLHLAAEAAARRVMEHGMRKVDVFVKGPGSGRETAIRSLQATGLEVGSIQDMTPVPHNGCRPPKRRRV